MTSIIAHVSAGGRIVIPAEIRRKMDIQSGDQVLLSYHDGELHIASRKQQLQQAKKIVLEFASEVSLAEQLLAERKAESNV
jgi:AbrB family looped-hinge helix DNA binding protein